MCLFLDVFPGYGANHGIFAQQKPKLVLQTLLFLLISTFATFGAPSSGSKMSSTCSFSGHQYDINQTWYRHLKTPNIDVCVLCLCKSDGLSAKMNCSNITCSAEMCDNVNKNDCCDFCYDPVSSTEVIKPLLPPEESESLRPCLHGGRIYQDGEEFTSNATGLQAQTPNQCVQCRCQAGLVMCRLKNCENVECFSSEVKNCCTSCKDEPDNEETIQPNPVLVTIMVSDGQSSSGDCSAAGVTYSHGSSWHPIIGPFGPMDCVDCKCRNSKIECSRLNCPKIEKSECKKPIQVPGHCCPLCTEEDQGNPLEAGVQPSLHEHAISVTMAQKGTPQAKESSNSVVDCLPPQTNTIVYRSHASSSSSAYYQYAFQSVSGDHSTRLLTWTVKDGRTGDFSEQHLSKEEFKSLMGTFQFKQQGATRTKFMEKFIRKAKRLPERCGSRCATKIHHLRQVLHLKEIEKRQKCQSQETSFQ